MITVSVFSIYFFCLHKIKSFEQKVEENKNKEHAKRLSKHENEDIGTLFRMDKNCSMHVKILHLAIGALYENQFHVFFYI